jgi:uncharacterized OB-fold protein
MSIIGADSPDHPIHDRCPKCGMASHKPDKFCDATAPDDEGTNYATSMRGDDAPPSGGGAL